MKKMLQGSIYRGLLSQGSCDFCNFHMGVESFNGLSGSRPSVDMPAVSTSICSLEVHMLFYIFKLFEALTRKVADLAGENENLKRELIFYCAHSLLVKFPEKEKELVEREYDSCGCQNDTATPPIVPMTVIDQSDSLCEQGNSMMINHLGTPLYILPCPWFFLHPNDGSRLHSQLFNVINKPDESNMNDHCASSSSLKATVHVENNSSPMKVKTKASELREAIAANLHESSSANLHHESSSGLPPDGGGQHTWSHPKGMVCMSAVHVEDENGLQPYYIPAVEAISSTVKSVSNCIARKE
ncbi:unnamed protein product [Ilex paraguariensis]|uniref:Uncharacterized protein n=1 Tax=Ilex paraguariensis TaxID=185542 RepID=A0ABC8TIK8_9AQUA